MHDERTGSGGPTRRGAPAGESDLLTPSDPLAPSDLLDVSDLDLDRLAALPDSVLRAAVRRVLARDRAAPDRFAAFQNSL